MSYKKKWGGKRVGAGRRKTPSTQLKEALAGLDGRIPGLFDKLEQWAEGKEVICPHCHKGTGITVPDNVALQAAVELINRRLGKPKQVQEIDITERIELTTDQAAMILLKAQEAQQAIEGEYKALPEGVTASDERSSSQNNT